MLTFFTRVKSISSFPTQAPRGGRRQDGQQSRTGFSEASLNPEGLHLKLGSSPCAPVTHPPPTAIPLQARLELEPLSGEKAQQSQWTRLGTQRLVDHSGVRCAGVLASGDKVSSRWGLPAPWGWQTGRQHLAEAEEGPLQPHNSARGLDPEESLTQGMRSHLDVQR